MYVRIDADAGFTESFGNDEIGGFSPNPFEGHQNVNAIRHFASEPLQQVTGDSLHSPRLGSIKADWINEFRDFLRSHREQRLGSGGMLK
jgi:hypothetical protein